MRIGVRVEMDEKGSDGESECESEGRNASRSQRKSEERIAMKAGVRVRLGMRME